LGSRARRHGRDSDARGKRGDSRAAGNCIRSKAPLTRSRFEHSRRRPRRSFRSSEDRRAEGTQRSGTEIVSGTLEGFRLQTKERIDSTLGRQFRKLRKFIGAICGIGGYLNGRSTILAVPVPTSTSVPGAPADRLTNPNAIGWLNRGDMSAVVI